MYSTRRDLASAEPSVAPGRPATASDRQVVHWPQLVARSLSCPADAVGLVLSACEIGPRRCGPRCRFIAAVLKQHRVGMLPLDRLMADDDGAGEDDAVASERLAQGLIEALDCLRDGVATPGLPPDLMHRRVGLLGSGVGAAAALRAAAARPASVASLVSLGLVGDLAALPLARVQAPTMLIVGGEDRTALALNRAALRALGCEKRLEVVPGATRRSQDPGALDAMAQLGGEWFARHSAQALGF